jgi:hypothetical protein
VDRAIFRPVYLPLYRWQTVTYVVVTFLPFAF